MECLRSDCNQASTLASCLKTKAAIKRSSLTVGWQATALQKALLLQLLAVVAASPLGSWCVLKVSSSSSSTWSTCDVLAGGCRAGGSMSPHCAPGTVHVPDCGPACQEMTEKEAQASVRPIAMTLLHTWLKIPSRQDCIPGWICTSACSAGCTARGAGRGGIRLRFLAGSPLWSKKECSSLPLGNWAQSTGRWCGFPRAHAVPTQCHSTEG